MRRPVSSGRSGCVVRLRIALTASSVSVSIGIASKYLVRVLRCAAQRAGPVFGGAKFLPMPSRNRPKQTPLGGDGSIRGFGGPGLFHPPFGEAVGTDVICESDHPQVAEGLPRSAVDRRALDNRKLRSDRH